MNHGIMVDTVAWAKMYDTFTCEQLSSIWDETGHSADLEALKRVAKELFPEISAPLYFYEGGHRAFDTPDGRVESPQYTLSSHLCRSIGIMRDGSTHPY